MSATIYTENNFNGDSHILNVGHYNAQYFRDIDYAHFDNISSIEVDRNTIVHLSTSSSATGFGDNRILIGPNSVQDLSALGIRGQIKSMRVMRFRQNNWGSPARVVVYNDYNLLGRSKVLREGNYSCDRLSRRENNESGFHDGDIRSLKVDAGVVAILYDGRNFEEDMNTVYVQGPATINSLNNYGLDGKLSSIRVFAVDPVPSGMPPNQQKNDIDPKFLYNWHTRQTLGRQDCTGHVCRAKIHHNKIDYLFWFFILVIIIIFVTMYGRAVYTNLYKLFHENKDANRM